MTDTERASRIAALNDALRKRAGLPTPGCTTLFMGDLAENLRHRHPVEALTVETNLLQQVRAFDAFTEDNDPHGEHDMGTVTGADGEDVMWKIDYYDTDKRFHSPDASDPAVTHRVLTIFYAADY